MEISKSQTLLSQKRSLTGEVRHMPRFLECKKLNIVIAIEKMYNGNKRRKWVH